MNKPLHPPPHQPALAFVHALDLPDPPPQLESLEASAVSFSAQPEAAAVGTQVTEFSARVPQSRRPAVADCLLLAQLAANKATAQDPDVMAWYRKYVEVLQGTGWTVQSMSFEARQLGNDDLGVHQAIIPVLTGMLGPVAAGVSLVISVLKGLQDMDKDKPWITLFDRASQHASGAKFQVGFIDADDSPDPAISIQLLAMAIDARLTITQVLFFKFSSQTARLDTAQGALGITGARLDSIKAAVAARMEPFLADNISKIDL